MIADKKLIIDKKDKNNNRNRNRNKDKDKEKNKIKNLNRKCFNSNKKLKSKRKIHFDNKILGSKINKIPEKILAKMKLRIKCKELKL